MTDPIQPPSGQILAQQALTRGLQNLLQSGPQRGLVTQVQPDGRVTLQLQAGSYQVQLESNTLRPGQAVLLRLAGEQVVIEFLADRSESPPSSPPVPRTLSNLLAQWGLSGAPPEIIAQALLQSGIPLEQTVLRDLAQLLPNVQTDALFALVFLLSRRFPISESLVLLLAQIFSRRPRVGESTNKILQNLERLEEELEEGDGEKEEVQEIRRNLHQFRHEMEQFVIPLRPEADPEYAEELAAAIQQLLQTVEALLGGKIQAGPASLQETLLRLLAYLLTLQTTLAGTPYHPWIMQLIEQVKELQESLHGQILRNVSPADKDAPHVFYFQLPLREGDKIKHLEVRYESKNRDRQSGTLDLRIELSGLGPLLISLQWQHPWLSITLVTPSTDVRTWLERELEALKESLQQLGYQVMQLNVVQREIPDSLQPEDLETGLRIPAGVDLKA